ncbi:MAG TPA: glycosyltransferase family 1 protein [Candidatus Dormibacteraeota bacterium]|nr:glycosyltransferase family 1 protein [Candidatus Dormibacteraeota bacterium]
MRLALEARTLGMAGIGRFTEGLWGGLVETGLDVVGLTGTGSDDWRRVEGGFPGSVVPVNARLFGVAEQVAVPRAIRRAAADIYHSTHLTVPYLDRHPVVLTVHDLFPVKWPRHARSRAAALYYRAMFPAAMRRAAAVVAVSPYTARMIQEVLPISEAKLHVVGHAVDHRRWSPATQEEVAPALAELGLTEPYLLYSGTAKWHKNLVTLIDAYGPDLPPLVLAGPTLEELRQAAPKSASMPNVIPIGRVDDGPLRLLYAGAEALVLPSLHESYAFSAVEAMACRTAVVCSSGGCLPETVGGAGLMLPAEDVGAWREGLRRIVSDDALRASLAEAGRERVAARTWRHVAEEYRLVYRLLD